MKRRLEKNMGKKKIIAMSTICADVFDTDEIRFGGEALNFAMNIVSYPNVLIGIMGAVGDDTYTFNIKEMVHAV